MLVDIFSRKYEVENLDRGSVFENFAISYFLIPSKIWGTFEISEHVSSYLLILLVLQSEQQECVHVN